MSEEAHLKPLTLAILRQLADGEFHSGETLARQLGVTRATVNNALSDVAVYGLVLHRVRGRGYQLRDPIQWLQRDEILRHMGEAAAQIHLEVIEQATSSNTLLLRRASTGAPSGTVLAVEWQTAGKGRMGRVWHSGLGDALTFSLLWRFQRGVAALSGLSLAIGVGVMRALQELGAPGVSLKWPNDVLLQGRKLAGILLEAQGDMLGPSAVVIGVGLNLKLSPVARKHIDQSADDLQAAVGSLERNPVLAVLLRHLLTVLREFEQSGFAGLRAEWEAKASYREEAVCIVLPDGTVNLGTMLGVSDDGALRLATSGGETLYNVGEVSLRSV